MQPLNVLTSEGYKPIDEVTVSDMVLSHDNKFHPVVRRHILNVPLTKFKCSFTPSNMQLPYNSSVWACEYRRGASFRAFAPDFVSFSDIAVSDAELQALNTRLGRHCPSRHGYYAGINYYDLSMYPNWSGEVKKFFKSGNYISISKKLSMYDRNLWYLVGCFLARGCCKIYSRLTERGLKSNSKPTVTFNIAASHPCDKFVKLLDNYTKYSSVIAEPKVQGYEAMRTFTIYDHEFCEFLNYMLLDFSINVSAYVCTKRILSLPVELKTAVAEGFMEFAGGYEGTDYVVSKENYIEVLNIAQLLMSVKHSGCLIDYKPLHRGKDTTSYKLRHNCSLIRTNTQVCNDATYFRVIRNIEPTVNDKYIALEVKDAHSYVLNNLIVGDIKYIK